MRTWCLLVFVGIGILHCAHTPADAKKELTTPSPAPTGEQSTSADSTKPEGAEQPLQCQAPSPACRHPEVSTAHICYGTNPGPNAPHSQQVCVCHLCNTDAECGADRRCEAQSPTCGAPQRSCIERCVKGECPNGYLCGDGWCLPQRAAPPP
jgi:hypothetical protein